MSTPIDSMQKNIECMLWVFCWSCQIRKYHPEMIDENNPLSRSYQRSTSNGIERGKTKDVPIISIIDDVNADVYILSISFQSMYTLRTVCHQHVNWFSIKLWHRYFIAYSNPSDNWLYHCDSMIDFHFFKVHFSFGSLDLITMMTKKAKIAHATNVLCWSIWRSEFKAHIWSR